MFKRPPHSLERSILTKLLALVIPALLVAFVLQYRAEERLLRSLFNQQLEQKASTLATLVTGKEDGSITLDFADEYMQEYSREKRRFYFQIWNSEGDQLERSVSLGERDLPRKLGPLETPTAFKARLNGTGLVYCVGVEFPLRLGATQNTTVGVVVASDPDPLNQVKRRALFHALVTTGLTLACVSAFIVIGLKLGSRSLLRLAKDVRSTGSSPDLTDLEPERSPREVLPLIHALNASRSYARELLARERRFSGDVAHELRTPISELRSAAEVAQKWPDPESCADLATSALEISVHMAGLIDSLLQLAGLEGDHLALEVSEFDLVQILRDDAQRLEAGAHQTQRISLEVPAELRIHSEPGFWSVILSNLLDNALRYSPKESQVVVSLERHAGGIRLRVANPAPGVTADTARRSTDRLWRSPDAASGDGHYGLGLSIVDVACARIGCRLSVSVEAGHFIADVQSLGGGDEIAALGK